MKEVKVTEIHGDAAKKISKILANEGILIYRNTKRGLDVLTERQTKEDMINHAMNKVHYGRKMMENAVQVMNDAYEECRKLHPEWVKEIEEQTQRINEFERTSKKKPKN